MGGRSMAVGAAAFAVLAVGVVAAAPEESALVATVRSTATPPPGIVQDESPVEVRSDGAIDDALYPYVTAQDWVTYADHVVVVTVTAERPLAEDPGKRGESYRGRDAILRVDETLWSSASPRNAPPRELSLNQWGWRIRAGEPDRPVRIAIEHRSRLEVGHTYIVPLRYIAASCGEGDGFVPARWVPLAGIAKLPYDGGTIGSGEIEGRYVSAADNGYRTDFRWLHSGLRRELNGQPGAALVAKLRATPRRAVGASEVG